MTSTKLIVKIINCYDNGMYIYFLIAQQLDSHGSLVDVNNEKACIFLLSQEIHFLKRWMWFIGTKLLKKKNKV